MGFKEEIDNFKYQGLRKKLIRELAEKGIKDQEVLAAMDGIPRHAFMDKAFDTYAAYNDIAFPIGAGQTISHPYTVARQTELLQVKKRDTVLEIGTGSGYQTCVLVAMGAKVFSIERQKELFDKTKIFLQEKMECNARLFHGDGYLGLPTFAPFDKIIVTAGAPFIPDPLLSQLKVGGTLVIPVGPSDKQVMTVIKRLTEKHYEQSEHGLFSFVPLLENKVLKK